MNRSSSFRGVLFDMDGVIIDSLGEVERFWIPRLAKKGIALTEMQFLEKLHGRPAIEVIEEFFGGKSEHEQKELHRECEKFDLEHDIRLVPGVKKLLNSLHNHNIPVGLVTSALPSKVKKTFEVLDANDYFASVITSVDVNEGKPHPGCYRKAAQTLNLNAEECIVFEDSVNGIQSGAAAGSFVVGVNKLIFEELLKEQGARVVIPNFLNVNIKESEDNRITMIAEDRSFSIQTMNK